ncbi:MAG: hypothetical protein RL685_5928 [Pseudomonadota bacterium]|jgi:hypothetical protein
MRAEPGAASLGLLALALLAAGCNVVYGELPIGQCVDDADCVTLGGTGYRCAAQRVCVATALTAPPLASQECPLPDSVSVAECAAGGCAVPLSSDCSCLSGAWADPQAVVVGVIAPRTFKAWSGEVLQLPYVPRWEQSLSLALAEWDSELPGGTPRSGRPLALLHCNSNDELFRARRAFTHLTQAAGAPVVITLTDHDTEAIQHQALRQNTAVMCSACFRGPPAEQTPTIWRVAPPLSDQAPLVAARANELAAGLRDASAEPPTIVILSQQYPGIDELVARVEQQLIVAGQLPVSVQTRDPRSEVVTQPQIAEEVISALPRVIVVGMDSDFTTYYLPLIEGGWPSGVPRPHYVLSYLNQELGLLADIVGNNEELRRRISGTGWHGDAAVAQALEGLDGRFFTRYQQHLDQAHYGYDALYAVAYALAWAQPRFELDGSGVMSGLSHLLAGPQVPVGPRAIKSTLALLEAGQDVNLVGSSGGLDWEPLRHTTRSDVSVWCLARNADTALEILTNAGPLWSAGSEEITGSYLCP